MQELDDKSIKDYMRSEASKNPEKFYPVKILKQEGFYRKRCKKCHRWFWTTDPNREVCGDSQCVGGFSFINNTPAKQKMNYVELWDHFKNFFEKRGYKAINRYPVVARWNPDLEFTIASIVDFQPFVVSGEVQPPANPLVVPQPCLRFNDIDNVGLTGSHFTSFVMIGQHAFMPPEDFDQEKYFFDIHQWLLKGIKIPKDEIFYHEDAWAGGGFGGASLEFFSRGLELGNQVYTMYDFSSGTIKPLRLRVLDMGAGQERMAWFTNGVATAYDITFPKVINYINTQTGIKIDYDFRSEFLKYAPMLNVSEVENVEKIWKDIAKKMKLDVGTLKKKAYVSQKVYSIAEHTRTLLFALNDGLLPSNVGGGYNLRVIFRRSFDFAILLGNFDFHKLFEIHAKELKLQYPELDQNLDEINDIIEEEIRKHKESKKKHANIIAKLDSIDVEKMIKLYDSYGITPDEVKEKFSDFEVPPNFYSLVSNLHQSVPVAKTKRELTIPLPELPQTQVLYYDDWKNVEFDAKILYVHFEDKKGYLVLDKTSFYPTSGGQLQDEGEIIVNNVSFKVIDVIKHNNVIVHVLNCESKNCEMLKVGTPVHGKVDFERRKQLAQHHTGVHLLNGVLQELYGKHIWQHSALKTIEKGRLDVTHHKTPFLDEIKVIEKKVKEYINMNLKVEKLFMSREVAEKEFGFRIYQGGVVPGKELRIVKIVKGNNILDVEACGGTHLNSTSEIEDFMITDVKKPQDGIVRFDFVAGKRARELKNYAFNLSNELVEMISEFVKVEEKDVNLENAYDTLKRVATELSCGVEQLKQTVGRFVREMKKLKEDYDLFLVVNAKGVQDALLKSFELWKTYKKKSEEKIKFLIDDIKTIILNSQSNVHYIDKDISILVEALKDPNLHKEKNVKNKNIFVYNSKGMFAFIGSDDIFNKMKSNGFVKGGGKEVKQGKVDLNFISEIKKLLE